MRTLSTFVHLLAGFAVAAEPTTRPFVVGQLEAPMLRESSGIVESRKHPGVFWTHNDSGNDPILYAIRRDGTLINQFPVNCVAFDWEDVATDEAGHLYLGDIGNNGNVRAAIGVTMIDEPDPHLAPDPKVLIKPAAQWLLTFPDNRRMDCESLFISRGEGYLVNKSVDRSPTRLWTFSLAERGPQEIKAVATLPIDAICTGADLSVDGDRLALMTVDGPVLFSGVGGDLSKLEHITPASIRIERRTNEAICLTEGGVLGTSEARDVYFFPFEAFSRPATTRP